MNRDAAIDSAIDVGGDMNRNAATDKVA